MISIDKMSRVPIYEQIETEIKDLIRTGLLKPGDRIPSVRALSIQLSINPNTSQKAYLSLDRHGLITSVAARGSFVSENAIAILTKAERKKLPELEALMGELLKSGISKEELQQALDNAVSQFEIR